MFLSSTYGYHPSNILTWINPSTGLLVESKGIQNGFDVTNYSLFGINLGNIPGDYEGYNYLGIGNIIIIILALIFMYSSCPVTNPRPLRTSRPALAFCC